MSLQSHFLVIEFVHSCIDQQTYENFDKDYCVSPSVPGQCRGIARSKYVGWTDMASTELEPITGVWRRSDPPTPPLNGKLFTSGACV